MTGGVLVIGATGQVARALAELGAGPCLGRDVLDLARPQTVAPAIRAHRPRLVVNAAAYTAVDRAEAEPGLARAVNATGVGALAEACAEAGAGLVHLSTDYVFPGSGTRPHAETDPTGPLNVYGATKLAGEREALAAHPRTAVFRTSWVYAPWGRNFVLTMLGLADRERLTVVDDQHGQPTSALQIARAVMAAAPRLAEAPEGDPAWGISHLAGAGETSWAGLAEAVFAEARAAGLIATAPKIVPITTADYPTPARRPLNSRLDCARFETLFAHPMAPWPTALAEVVARIARA